MGGMRATIARLPRLALLGCEEAILSDGIGRIF